MPTLMGFGTFAGLPEEQISEKISRRILSGDQGMIVWWSIRAGVHVEPHSHANEQIVWMLKGKMEFRLGSEQRVCGPGDVVVIPGGAEHEAWFREGTEVIDFFAPPRVHRQYRLRVDLPDCGSGGVLRARSLPDAGDASYQHLEAGRGQSRGIARQFTVRGRSAPYGRLFD